MSRGDALSSTNRRTRPVSRATSIRSERRRPESTEVGATRKAAAIWWPWSGLLLLLPSASSWTGEEEEKRADQVSRLCQSKRTCRISLVWFCCAGSDELLLFLFLSRAAPLRDATRIRYCCGEAESCLTTRLPTVPVPPSTRIVGGCEEADIITLRCVLTLEVIRKCKCCYPTMKTTMFANQLTL